MLLARTRFLMPDFLTTSWSIVLQAAGGSAQGRQALEELCQVYWYPLYAFVRRQGSAPHDAEDAVQSFFVWLVESNLLGRADPERGRFRCFLLAALKQFLAGEYRRASAAKRRPKNPLLSIDMTSAAASYQNEPYHELTAERQFDYSWAMAVLERALERLRGEWQQAGKESAFQILQEHLTGNGAVRGRDLARQLNMSEGAVRVALHRLRRRYGEILREEIGQTLGPEGEIDAELEQLRAALKMGAHL
jgi:RNA polymerase sigma-70 factor (ECF subfamily)